MANLSVIPVWGLFSNALAQVISQLLSVEPAGGNSGSDADGRSWVNTALACAGLMCAALVLLVALAWVPTTAAFLAYGAVYPFIPLAAGRCTSSSSGGGGSQDTAAGTNSSTGYADAGHHELQCALTGIYLGTVCLLCCLAPAVYRFQLLWADLVDVKGFPPLFYQHAREGGVVAELWTRYRKAVDKRALERVLDARLGSQLSCYARKFIAKGW